MIGDWVFCEGQPIPSNVTIQSIAEDGVWFMGDKVEGAATFDRIFPIPITPEILEKNGFEKLGFDGWEFDYEDEDECLIYEVLWRCDYPKEYHTHLTINSYYPDFGSFKSFRIDSVHELQHVLRLCGIEKEFKI